MWRAFFPFLSLMAKWHLYTQEFPFQRKLKSNWRCLHRWWLSSCFSYVFLFFFLFSVESGDWIGNFNLTWANIFPYAVKQYLPFCLFCSPDIGGSVCFLSLFSCKIESTVFDISLKIKIITFWLLLILCFLNLYDRKKSPLFQMVQPILL